MGLQRPSRSIHVLDESLESSSIREPLRWDFIPEQLGGSGEGKRKTMPIRSRSDDLGQDGNPVFCILFGVIGPLQGHGDHASGQPAFIIDNVHSAGTDIPHRAGLWSSTGPVIGDQPGQRVSLRLIRRYPPEQTGRPGILASGRRFRFHLVLHVLKVCRRPGGSRCATHRRVA
jgi:hypothetical protein